MRAICGAIITAGALIGLGLTALGYGIRFQQFGLDKLHPQTQHVYGATTLMIALVVLLVSIGIGLAIAFLGLAYHHERRYRESLPPTAGNTTAPRVTV